MPEGGKNNNAESSRGSSFSDIRNKRDHISGKRPEMDARSKKTRAMDFHVGDLDLDDVQAWGADRRRGKLDLVTHDVKSAKKRVIDTYRILVRETFYTERGHGIA